MATGQLFSKTTQALFYNYKQLPIQRMLDFDFLCRRETPSIAGIINPGSEGFQKLFFGQEEIAIPVHLGIEAACAAHPTADVFINFASFRSAAASSMAALKQPTIRVVVIIAEGVPESDTKQLVAYAKANNKVVIGPATVGGIQAGAFKIGDTAGTIDNIIHCKLYRPGSVGFVSKSGGMSSELYNTIARVTDGIYEGIAIGGDVFPGSTLSDHVLRFNNIPQVKMVVVLGELGGRDEYSLVEALQQGKINKPVVAWVSGTCARLFKSEVQFGHAGAKSGGEMESAQAKNQALRDAGAVVPTSYEAFEGAIKETFEKLVEAGKITPVKEVVPPQIPEDLNTAIKSGKVRAPTHIITTICDERGEEPCYAGVPIFSLVEQGLGVGDVISLLWFKRSLPRYCSRFIEICIMLCADHGPCVSGAHNTIVTSRAGKDVVSCLVSGLLTIGPRFGGAIDDAARYFKDAYDRGLTPYEFVEGMKKKGIRVAGIGHRNRCIDDVENNDDNMKAVKSRPAADEVEEWGDSTEISWFSSCQILDKDGDETARKEGPLLPRHKHEHQLQLVVDCMSLDDLDFDEEASSVQPFSGNQELSESKRKRAENALPSSLKLLYNFQNRFRRLTGEKVNAAAPSCSSSHDESREMNCCSSTRLWINEILQLAAHKFIENSSHGDSELNNLFPNSCWGLHGEDYKDVELLLHLLASAERVGQKKFDSAKGFLSMCDKLSSKNGNLVQRLVYYFSEALRDKVDWQTGEKSPENFGKKQIEYLKEELTCPKKCILETHQNFPFLQVIEFASVQAVIEHVAEAKKIHIIDLEINHGMQWTILMQALAAARHAESSIENLKISALVIKSGPLIEETGKQLTSFADSLKIPFSFKTVKVQDILEVNEQSFEVEEDEALAVYGLFFFMTMISKQDRLEHLMRVMRTIRPRVMVITEVEANHNSPVFVNRFTESLFFYSAFLDSLEHFLKHDEYIRANLEREQLSHRIRNIVAAEGEERVIRHVSMNVWRAFFARFGMKEVEMSMSSVLQANLVFNNFPYGKYCTLDNDGKSMIIGWKKTPLFSVSAWKLSN